MLVLHKGLVPLLLAMCACMGQSSVILTELCTLSVEPKFLGHVSEHTFASADTEMAQFVRCARG